MPPLFCSCCRDNKPEKVKMPSQEDLGKLVERLEKVTNRLEQLSSRPGSGAGSGSSGAHEGKLFTTTQDIYNLNRSIKLFLIVYFSCRGSCLCQRV